MPVIKRYSNRKLYDTETKQYITLEGVANLIRQGEDVQVIEHDTGSDITALVSAQIILAQERKASGWLPQSLLKNLVHAGSDTLNHLRLSIIPPAELAAAVDAEIERRIKVLIVQGDLKESDGQRLLTKVMTTPLPTKGRRSSKDNLKQALGQRHLPTRAEFEKLKRQVVSLNAELERMTSGDSIKSKS